MNYRKVLADNVTALMERTEALSSHAKLAKHCSTPTRKIGARTVGHLLNWKDGPNPKLDTIIAVADAFRVQPWLLLSPNFDAEKKAEAEPPSGDDIVLARRIASMPAQKRELLIEIFGDGVPDEEMEATGWKAPPAATVHEPRASYKKPPRQLKMKLKS